MRCFLPVNDGGDFLRVFCRSRSSVKLEIGHVCFRLFIVLFLPFFSPFCTDRIILNYESYIVHVWHKQPHGVMYRHGDLSSIVHL